MNLPIELLAVTNDYLMWDDVLTLDITLLCDRDPRGHRLFLLHLPNLQVKTLLYAYPMNMLGSIYPLRLRRWMAVRQITLVEVSAGTPNYVTHRFH